MNQKLIQSNLITLHEIYTRTELWKDKIYYISNHPYKFPKNDGSGDFLPLPKRFAEIITEFKEEINKQKQSERPESERQEAQQRINEIYQQIKKLIQTRIEEVENYQIEIEDEEIEEAWKQSQQTEQIIKDIQAFFQGEYNFLSDPSMATERWYKQADLQPFLKETDYNKFKEWEKKHGIIVKYEIVEESDDDLYDDDEPKLQREEEINLLAEWENINGGLPPFLKKIRRK